jgi:hypothetical protein
MTLPPTDAPPNEPPVPLVTVPVTWEQTAHRGDWAGFKIWLFGVAFVATINLFDLIRGLLGF